MDKAVLTALLGDQTRIDASSLRSGSGIPNGGAEVFRLLDDHSLSFRLCFLLLLPLDFLWITVEEHVNHYVPAVRSPRNRSAQTKDFTGKEPPDKTNGMSGLVIGGDSNIDEFQGCVSVAESDDGDVNV